MGPFVAWRRSVLHSSYAAASSRCRSQNRRNATNAQSASTPRIGHASTKALYVAVAAEAAANARTNHLERASCQYESSMMETAAVPNTVSMVRFYGCGGALSVEPKHVY